MTLPRAKNWMHRLAHDLRGPLSPMQVSIYLLRDQSLEEGERNELFAVIERQISRLGSMIDELGDLGHAEQDRLVTRRESLDLDLLLEDLSSQLRAKPPEISFAPDACAVELEGDVVRLGQLFKCLLGLRLTRHQDTPVRAHLSWSAPGRLQMRCTIACRDASSDLGEALLTMPHPEPPDEGLGLGLLIASAIAEAHGGSLRAEAGTSDAIELLLELPARPAC